MPTLSPGVILELVRCRCHTFKNSTKLLGIGIGIAAVLFAVLSWSLLTSWKDRSEVTCSRGHDQSGDIATPQGYMGGKSTGASCHEDGCPWQFVISDLANRLHLLEMAFKEQVVAREVIAQEVSNQSGSNLLLEKKLIAFMNRIDEIEVMVKAVDSRLQELSARLYSDEFIGFLVILAILVEVLLRVRPKVGDVGQGQVPQRPRTLAPEQNKQTSDTPASTAVTPAVQQQSKHTADGRLELVENLSNGGAAQNGVSFSPKHGLFLKSELCIVAFHKDNASLTSFIDTTLRHLDGIRLSIRPYYVIESHDQLRQCPRTKLYIVIFEMEERVSGGGRSQDSDLITSTVRYIKSLGAILILIVTNDEGSKKLTIHALYNTHLRLLQSHEAFQDLTSNARVFSTWRDLTSHQISHMRKIVRTALNLKTNLR